jgi:hypothetical protein
MLKKTLKRGKNEQRNKHVDKAFMLSLCSIKKLTIKYYSIIVGFVAFNKGNIKITIINLICQKR